MHNHRRIQGRGAAPWTFSQKTQSCAHFVSIFPFQYWEMKQNDIFDVDNEISATVPLMKVTIMHIIFAYLCTDNDRILLQLFKDSVSLPNTNTYILHLFATEENGG